MHHLRKSVFTLLTWGMVLSLMPILLKGDLNDLDDEELERKVHEATLDHDMDPSTSQVMTAPKVSDEERGSRHMPKHLRCSGCKAIAYQFDLGFKKALKSVKSGSKLPLADQIDVAEIVCEEKMDGYGLKDVKGKKMLSGPGLGADKFPGVMEAGGKWEARLKTMCLEIVEEFEEDGIYDIYTESDEAPFAQGLCVSYCGDKDQGKSQKNQQSEKEEL